MSILLMFFHKYICFYKHPSSCKYIKYIYFFSEPIFGYVSVCVQLSSSKEGLISCLNLFESLHFTSPSVDSMCLLK